MSNFVEIRPRELKPALLELDGISRTSIEAHYRLYQGYVAKRNEILGRLATVDLGAREPGVLGGRGAQGRSHVRRRRDQEPRGLLRASRRRGRRPGRRDRRAHRARLRLGGRLARRPPRDGHGRRGWAWTAYDWDEGRLFNYIGDAQNTFPVWNATPLVALDVYEHAYFLDYQTDRAAYIEAFLRNLDWGVVNHWVGYYSHPGRVAP